VKLFPIQVFWLAPLGTGTGLIFSRSFFILKFSESTFSHNSKE
jgi:hypothetical protein